MAVPRVAAARVQQLSLRRSPFVCPECRKPFLCESNLRHHRLSRHSVYLASPEEEERQKYEAKNTALQEQLAQIQGALRKWTDGLRPTDSCTAPPSSLVADVGSSAAATGPGVHFSSAVPTGQVTAVDAATLTVWQESGKAIGTGISYWMGVGMVVEPVEVGHLTAASQAVLQFTLETHGYYERRPGQLKLYQNRIVIRYIPSQGYHATPANVLPFSVKEGDVLSVQGHYALHKSYDIVSKQGTENVVVEADAIGLLRSSHIGGSGTGTAATTTAAGPLRLKKEPPPPPAWTRGPSPSVEPACVEECRPTLVDQCTAAAVPTPSRSKAQKKTEQTTAEAAKEKEKAKKRKKKKIPKSRPKGSKSR